MKKKSIYLSFVVLITSLCSGCYSRSNIVAGLSEELKTQYSMYPSVEIDVVAVTKDEAEKLKQKSLEDYFSMSNLDRKKIAPYTMSFSSEQTEPQEMDRGVNQWDAWEEKDLDKILVIANVPRVSEAELMNSDPRVIFIDMESAFLWPDSFYFKVQPGSLTQVYKTPTDPEAEAKAKKKKEDELKAKEAKKKKKKKK